MEVVVERSKIRCCYPLDAYSDKRDNKACGPFSDDPKYGHQRPKHINRKKRKKVERDKIKRFGPNTKWEDIPCTKWFHFNDDDTNKEKSYINKFVMRIHT